MTQEIRKINGKWVVVGEIEDFAEEQSPSMATIAIEEIDEMRKRLTSLDYKTIKRMQGVLTDEEWEQTKTECAALRARINELENELNNGNESNSNQEG